MNDPITSNVFKEIVNYGEHKCRRSHGRFHDFMKTRWPYWIGMLIKRSTCMNIPSIGFVELTRLGLEPNYMYLAQIQKAIW